MRYKFLFVAISTAFFTLTSCHSKSDQPLPTGSREISFSLGGEFADVTYEPLSRAANPAKYYAMNISRRSNPSKSGENYEPYAYGVFDNIDDMKITLSPEYTYKFECTSLLEDKQQIAKIDDGNGGIFMFPFCINGTQGYSLDNLNKFVTSETEYMPELSRGKSTVTDGGVDENGFATKYKNVDFYPSQMRYYGVVEDYILNTLNSVSISMKSVSFGLKIVIPKMPGGRIKITDSQNYLEPIIIDAPQSEPNNVESITKYAFDDADCIAGFPKDQKSFLLKFEWQINESTKSAVQPIEVRRNTLSVITINLANIDKEISFNITEEAGLSAIEDDKNTNVEVTIK